MASNQPVSQTVSLQDELLAATHFDKREYEVLCKRFQSLKPQVTPAGLERVDKQHFRDLLGKRFGITESLLMERVFRVFDQDADNFIGFSEFIRGLSVFLKGNKEEQLKYCFKIYDLNGDRYISKEEMFQLLQNCLVKATEDDDDGVKDIVELVLKKLDEDRDGRVNEQDWSMAVNKDLLLLEAFGQCLPDQRDIDEFLDVVDVNAKNSAFSEMLKTKNSAPAPAAAPVKKPATAVAK